MRSFIIKFILILLGFFVFFYLLLSSVPYPYLKVQNQSVGSTVLVKEARLSKSGFLMVQTVDEKTGLPNRTGYINVPTYMPKGIYKDINVVLSLPEGGYPSKVAVVLYEDTNSNYDFDGFYEPSELNPAPESGFDSESFSILGNIVRKIITFN